MAITQINPIDPSKTDLFLTPITICFLTKPPINTSLIDVFSTGNFLKCQTLIKNFTVGEKSIKVEKILENLQWKQFVIAIGDGSTGGSQFNLTFTEDGNATVTNTFLLLYDYIKTVVEGKSSKYQPKQADIDNNILDYTMSLYAINLRPNGKEVVGFFKICNLILTSCSTDVFNFDRTVIDQKYPNFSFSSDTSKINEPFILDELADLLGTSGDLYEMDNGRMVLTDEFHKEILRYIGSSEKNFEDDSYYKNNN